MPGYINALIDSVAVVVVLTVLIADLRTPLNFPIGSRLFRTLLLLVAGVLLFDIPAWLLDGVLFPGARALCYTLDTLYYVCQIVYCYFWLVFADYWNFPTDTNRFARLRLYALPMLLELTLVLINPFTGWVFSINAANVYSRGVYYAVNLIPYCLYIAGSLLLTLLSIFNAKEQDQRRKSTLLIVFMFLPVCGAILESLYYGVSWLWPFIALSLLMVYTNVQQQQLSDQRVAVVRQSEEAAELRNELTNSRVAIMLSQMQPHFLFNSLSSIQSLCKQDPSLAASATGEFAAFLRGNIDSLSAEKPISFQQELEHTKHYLALEQIRFQNRLTVSYDLPVTLFRMPTLTLQPIVENAVRYGVMSRIEGVTIKISTTETEDIYRITVSDTGMGFDPMQTKSEDRSHIGIRNVQDRLKAMCGGTLRICSTPGVGTVAEISIPKERPLC